MIIPALSIFGFIIGVSFTYFLIYNASENDGGLIGVAIVLPIFSLRNIIAYHFKRPFWWYYSYSKDLKNDKKFQLKIYYSNWTMLVMGLMCAWAVLSDYVV